MEFIYGIVTCLFTLLLYAANRKIDKLKDRIDTLEGKPHEEDKD